MDQFHPDSVDPLSTYSSVTKIRNSTIVCTVAHHSLMLLLRGNGGEGERKREKEREKEKDRGKERERDSE